jgi:hypothetical protein
VKQIGADHQTSLVAYPYVKAIAPLSEYGSDISWFVPLAHIVMLQCAAVPGESGAIWDQSLLEIYVTVRSSCQVMRTVLRGCNIYIFSYI